jgi:hypothetical protein
MEHLKDGLRVVPRLVELVRPGGVFLMAVPPSEGIPDDNHFHFSEHPATAWKATLETCFEQVTCFGHQGWGRPPQEQEFPPFAAEDLLPERTSTAVLLGRRK